MVVVATFTHWVLEGGGYRSVSGLDTDSIELADPQPAPAPVLECPSPGTPARLQPSSQAVSRKATVPLTQTFARPLIIRKISNDYLAIHHKHLGSAIQGPPDTSARGMAPYPSCTSGVGSHYQAHDLGPWNSVATCGVGQVGRESSADGRGQSP